MSNKESDKKAGVSIADALKTQVVVNQALIDILITKGIFTRDELISQIQIIKQEMEEKETTN